MVHRYLGSIALLLSLLLMIVTAGPVSAENGSLLFDGTDDYVSVPEPVDLSGPLTIEAWIKASTLSGGCRIVSNRTGANGYEIDVAQNSGVYRFRFIFDGSLAGEAVFTPYVGVWTHVAAVWDGPSVSTTHIYINGVEENQGWVAAITSSPGPLRIGGSASGGFFFPGQIDEVRIWSAALDGATIASWMSRPLTVDHPNHGSLEAYWNFDEGSGQVLHNQTGDARRDGELGSSTGEDSDDPQWQRDGAPVPVEPATIGQIKQRFMNQ